MPVIAAGQRVFGENRVQEAKAKWPALRAAHPGIDLHLIGPLQSNKAKEAVALFDAIHSVDRPSIAEALAQGDRQAGAPSAAVRGGEHRRGAAEGRRPAARGRCVHQDLPRNATAWTIAGLMCIPPFEEAPAPHFALTAKIAARNGLEAAVDGDERGFCDRDRVRRDPCAGRNRDFRRPGEAQKKSPDAGLGG